MCKITEIIFKYQGIIYGGFVRDTIISEHYMKLFYDSNKEHIHIDDKYKWNEKFNPETAYRTLVPNDIDVCIYNIHVVSNMIADITDLISKEFGETNVVLTGRLIECYSEVEKLNDILGGTTVQRFDYSVTFGNIPFVTQGQKLNILLDVVTPTKTSLVPPFNRLDFLCNGFIMTAPNRINLSSCTGTEIDKLSLVEKKKIEFKIIKDIINFKTDYCMKFILPLQQPSYNAKLIYERSAFDRILKMISKTNMWTIGNMPIIIHKKHINYQNKKNVRTCCICCDSIRYNDAHTYIPSLDSNKNIIQGTHMHAFCLFEYLKSQIRNSIDEVNNGYIDNYETIVLKCPMRNKLDFDCQSLSNVIERYLHD